MIHELIDPKKRANKTGASRNPKTFQENKTAFENFNFEPNDCENREAESSSSTFIPPWLRNSLGLNQRNNLSHATASSDTKSAKITQRGKELDQNELDTLRINIEQDCCKKATNHFTTVPQELSQEDNCTKNTDTNEAFNSKNDREISVYWNVKCKDSETESSCANVETKSVIKEDLKMTNADVITSAEISKLKEEEKKKFRQIKQKNKLKNRSTGDQKLSDLGESNVDLVLEMKAKEDNFPKSDLRSEIRNLEAKLTPMNPKSSNVSKTKLNQQELRLLEEIKNHVGNVEEVEKLFEHVKKISMREITKNTGFPSKNITEKKHEDKEEMNVKEATQKCPHEGKSNGDKDSLLSTDDENDIKRFSEFLSKNKNLDEKRKCLEEVRNYFERKRKIRMSKRRFLEEEKLKLNLEPEMREEHVKDKLKFKDFYRGKKSKFALCDEEIVEKAVDETLQKFVEMYHIHVTPVIMGNMKKNILQAMTTDSLDSRHKFPEISSVKKVNGDFLNVTSKDKELEKIETSSFPETESTEVSNKESTVHKEIKKKNFKTLIESTAEQGSKSMKVINFVENEMLKHFRKEFDNFLYSVQNNIDISNLKLQSIILEKEEQPGSSKNIRFVYSFTKKVLEFEKTKNPEFKDSLECKNCNDSETQTSPETELIRRNVKVQAFEPKNNCEESLQTEDIIYVEESTQTNDEELNFGEIKELTSCDINPGLYRMIKSKEVGKFYLYPEPWQNSIQDAKEDYTLSAMKGKKFNKKKELLNWLAKERTKERRIFFREKERTKLKENKRTIHELAPLKHISPIKENSTVRNENSISCLYFRDLDGKNSESFSSKKEDLTEENASVRLDGSEELRLGDVKDEIHKEEHLGHFWFWDGEKITPGCDLKTHVEDLLKEKLKEITNFKNCQNELIADSLSLSKEKRQQSKLSQKNFDSSNANTVFCFNSVQDNMKGSALVFTENECIKEINKIEGKNIEDEDTEKTPMPLAEDKSVRNVATQNSQQTFLSLNVSKFKVQSKVSTPTKKEFNKRHIFIKPVHGKTINLKRAEDIIKAFEELKRIKLGLENSKKENSPDSCSLMDNDTSTSRSKDETEGCLSIILGFKNGSEADEISNFDFKSKIKKLVRFVDREIQTADICELENASYMENKTLGTQKHLKLIESVLNRVNHKKREDLWNDVREFIKAKIGRDINDEGAREVCIEIEQDIPKNEQGKPKHPVLAKGHYSRNEGDVEVEIDLTLDDLERILRQRQRKIRRRTTYRSSRSKKFLSSSSTQSDFSKNDFRKYQKYLHRVAILKGGVIQDQDMKAFLEKKNPSKIRSSFGLSDQDELEGQNQPFT